MRDPMQQLLEELRREGAPTLAFTLRFGAGGADAIEGAWARSRAPAAMVALLRLAQHPRLAEAEALLRAPLHFVGTDSDVARSDALRRLVPAPPSFSEVLAAGAALRAG